MICPISYKDVTAGYYSIEGLHKLSPKLNALDVFTLSADEQQTQIDRRFDRYAIPGSQPKLMVRLNLRHSRFDVVDCDGNYIIKPQQLFYPELPENENVTMKMAERAGVNVPINGLLRCCDGTWSYFVKRYDRATNNRRIAAEKLYYLLGMRTESKYDSDLKTVAQALDTFCTFPMVEKQKLLRVTIFNFLVGNDDMHLKDFVLLRNGSKIELAPFCGLLNSTLQYQSNNDTALAVNGKKTNLNRDDFMAMGCKELGLNEKIVDKEITTLCALRDDFESLLSRCFLSDYAKKSYYSIMSRRYDIMR